MKKDEFIAKYGEEAWEKKLEKLRTHYKVHSEELKARVKKYQDAHPEQARERGKKWRETHPEQVQANHQEEYKKGGKHYEKTLIAHHSGVPGEKNRIRAKHGKQYRPYKAIIAPDSQIHHEWIGKTAEYRGIALVETKPHQYGIIDVIQILDGEITLLTEDEVKRGDECGT